MGHLRFRRSYNLETYDIVQAVIHLQSGIQPKQWAQQILAFLRTRAPSELLGLATDYLNHLLVTSIHFLTYAYCRFAYPEIQDVKGRHKSPTPDIVRLHSIKDLLNDETVDRKQR